MASIKIEDYYVLSDWLFKVSIHDMAINLGGTGIYFTFFSPPVEGFINS